MDSAERYKLAMAGEFTERTFYQNIADAWSDLLAFQMENLGAKKGDPGLFTDPAVTSDHGKKAFIITWVDVKHVVFVIDEMALDALIPIRYLLTQPGWSRFVTFDLNPESDRTAFYNVLKDWVFAFRFDIVQLCTDGTPDVPVQKDGEPQYGPMVRTNQFMTIEGPNQWYVDECGWTITNNLPPDGTSIESAAAASFPNQPGGTGLIPTRSIVEAIQEVADVDYNISINHGQSIFSVKGRIVT